MHTCLTNFISLVSVVLDSPSSGWHKLGFQATKTCQVYRCRPLGKRPLQIANAVAAFGSLYGALNLSCRDLYD